MAQVIRGFESRPLRRIARLALSPAAPYGLPTMEISAVDFVTVPTTDFERAEAFYRDVLGLTPGKRWGDRPAGEFEAGQLTLAVMQMDGFGMEFRRSSTAIAFRVADVVAAKVELEGKGIAFQGDIIDSGVCHQAYFADPDGNPLVLHHRYA
jgi:catechol 2,3-dioxygenase-like lactoylglutathione lyase family enzyme